jgi:hypothetical protein
METAKYVTLEEFDVEISSGPKTFQRGEVLSLTEAKARVLLDGSLILRVITTASGPRGENQCRLSEYEKRVLALQATAGLPPQVAERIAADAIVSSLRRQQALATVIPKPLPFDPPRKSKHRFNKEKSEGGVGEWATHSYNIAMGCENGCQYCFAKARALRFKQVTSNTEWIDAKLKKDKVEIYQKVDGIVMFPSSHDITRGNLETYLKTAENILRSGNQLLIVSKPSLQCIPTLCNQLMPYRDKINFRFTIGTMDNRTARLLEPYAPLPDERISCLKYAYESGYKTSVSSEPLLGGLQTAQAIYASTEPYITDTIWFGKISRPPITNQPKDIVDKLVWIKTQQSDERIRRLHDVFDGQEKVRWKDSIQKVMAK